MIVCVWGGGWWRTAIEGKASALLAAGVQGRGISWLVKPQSSGLVIFQGHHAAWAGQVTEHQLQRLTQCHVGWMVECVVVLTAK